MMLNGMDKEEVAASVCEDYDLTKHYRLCDIATTRTPMLCCKIDQHKDKVPMWGSREYPLCPLSIPFTGRQQLREGIIVR
jgi:hypothetical protein